ncbi:MAG: ATP synthase subunit I [Brachymonas sp.]|nr:ATP synthase subunit I [Brachymonas sp.]
MQVLVSVLMLAGAVLAGWSRSVQVSLFWGAAACVVPSLLCLLGYLGTGQMLKRMPQAVRARLGLLSVVFWESVKLLLSVVFLLGTHFLVKQLNWMALLVAFIVVVKTFWLAALVDHLRRQRVQRVLKTGI